MKPEQIIELAKKAGASTGVYEWVSSDVGATVFTAPELERLLTLHRQALIDSGELVEKSAIAELIEAAEMVSHTTTDSKASGYLAEALAKIKEQP